MKFTRWACGLVAGFFAWGLLGAMGVLAADAPASISISVIKDKKTPVLFQHKAHIKILAGKCANCHSKADGSGGLKAELKQKPADMASAMKHPFHNECLGCHKVSGQATAPVKCDGCHK